MSGTVDIKGPSTGAPLITPAGFNAAVNTALVTKADAATVQASATQLAAVQGVVTGNQQMIANLTPSVAATATAIAALQSLMTATENRVTVLETAVPPPAAPGAPTGLTVGVITNTSIAFTWVAPVGGAAPTSYTLQYAPAGTGNYVNGPSGAGLSGTVTGLTAGTAYDFHVIATNAAGPGSASTPPVTRTTTVSFTPSPAFTSIPNAASITANDGGVWTVVPYPTSTVGGVVKLGGVNVGSTSNVILLLISDTGRIYQESNDPSLANQPGGVGWWYYDATQNPVWVFSSDPRPAAPGQRNPNTIAFASNSVWNIGMGNDATWAAANAPETVTLRSLTFAVNASGYGQPIYFGGPSDPVVAFHCNGGGQSGPGLGGTVPWDASFHCPANAVPSAGFDMHMNVFDSTQPLRALTMFGCTFNNGTDVTGGVTSNLGSILDLTQAGLIYPTDMNGTGDNYLGGTITDYDLAQGVIRHMVRCVIDPAKLLSPNPNDGDQTGVEWPNTHVDFQHGPGVYTGNIPVGTYGIPNSVNLSTLGLSAGGMMLATCLQNYGGLWRDSGGTNDFVVYTTPENENHTLIQGMRADGPKIMAVICRMTNQSATNVNGGGTRRAVLLPPVG